MTSVFHYMYTQLKTYKRKLFQYIAQEDIENLQKILLKNIPLNRYRKGDYTPIHFSILNNIGVDILRLLIKYGSDVNAVDKNGQTPLQYAFHDRNLNFMNLLLINGADPNVKDKNNSTILHYAADKKDCIKTPDCSKNVISLLLKYNANVNLKDADGYTPISYAVESKNIDIIELLLANGANINYYYDYGHTCLLSAIERDADEDIFKLYIQYGCDVNRKNYANRISPLLAAVVLKKLNYMKILLDNGANPNEKDNSQKTSLYYAIANSENTDVDMEIISLLLHYNVDVNSVDLEGFTPLHFILCFNHVKSKIDLISLLLEHNADVNIADGQGRTCLMHSILLKQYEIAELLIANNANVNHQTPEGYTALHHAVQEREISFVNLLLKHGAIIDTYYSRIEKTPLKTAVEQGHKEILNILLKSGQNLSLQDKNKDLLEFALNLTKQHHIELDDELIRAPLPEGNGFYEDFVTLLLDFGADINSIPLSRLSDTSQICTLCRDILLIHIIKLKDQNSYVSPETLTFLENEMKALNSSWQTEVLLLKNETLHFDYTISLYDILTKTPQTLVAYLGSKDIREAIWNYFDDKKFGRYTSFLKYRFSNSVEIIDNFNECCKIMKPIFNEAFTKFIPAEIFNRIMLGLNDYDLSLILKGNTN